MPATTSIPPTATTMAAAAFNNIPARSREQRIAVRDKEQWEKDRLRQRKGGFVRIDTSVTGRAMLVYEAGSQGYMCDADRFHSDTAGEERVAREERHTRTRLQEERKRYDSVQREITRWRDMDTAAAAEEQRWEQHRAAGTKALRNKSGEAFNPITLQYNDGRDGERLRAADAMVKQRAVARAENLRHHNSRGGVNPITGEALRPIRIEQLLPPPQ